MNAKKLIVVMSAALLGLASCGGNGGNNELTRKEVEAKLDAIVAAKPAAQTKLTAVNKTMDPSAVVGTYVFDAEAEYSHVKYTAAKTIKLSAEQSVSVTEIFAYAAAKQAMGCRVKIIHIGPIPESTRLPDGLDIYTYREEEHRAAGTSSAPPAAS